MFRALEPAWQPYRIFKYRLKPKVVADWMLEPGSMTARLREFGGTSFHVNVVQHNWGTPRLSELSALHLPAGSAAIIREVELICHQQVCIFARSVYPAASMVEKNYILRHLGERPVGDLLYADAKLKRSEFALAQIRPGHTDYKHAITHLQQHPKHLWARRSVFIVNCRPVLISEVFLPTIYACKQPF